MYITNLLMVNTKLIRISKTTDDQLDSCFKDYLRHHPEMKEIKISYNKLIFELSKFYLKM